MWLVTIFVILKSFGFLGLVCLLEFIGVKNSFAGIAQTILKKRVSCCCFLLFEETAVQGLSARW